MHEDGGSSKEVGRMSQEGAEEEDGRYHVGHSVEETAKGQVLEACVVPA